MRGMQWARREVVSAPARVPAPPPHPSLLLTRYPLPFPSSEFRLAAVFLPFSPLLSLSLFPSTFAFYLRKARLLSASALRTLHRGLRSCEINFSTHVLR